MISLLVWSVTSHRIGQVGDHADVWKCKTIISFLFLFVCLFFSEEDQCHQKELEQKEQYVKNS